MQRVVIAPWMATVALGALTFFGLAGLAIGALLPIGADAVARETGSAPGAVMVTGGVIAAVAVGVLVLVVRQWPAVRVIVIDGAGWILIDRLGRALAVEAGTPVELALRCRRVVFTWGSVPRIQDVVDGELHAGAERRRLASSGRHTYATVLAALGARGEPPTRGTHNHYTVVVTPR